MIPSEADIVQANKLAFGDEIGSVTNRITSMIEVRSRFPSGSKEYQTLNYRIMCGQHYQQNAIDKAKGIIAKPMPKYWYDRAACKISEDDSEAVRKEKEFNLSIIADKKPYFMKYVYPDVMAEYNRYIKNTNKKCIREFQMPLEQLQKKDSLSEKEKTFLDYYERLMPVGNSPCIINRICRLIEREFGGVLNQKTENSSFDHSILKSDTVYGKREFAKIQKIYEEYLDELHQYSAILKEERSDKEASQLQRTFMLNKFKRECFELCPDRKELCNILIDLCYTSSKSKQFVWDICGDVIIENLLERNDHTICYPYRVENGDFEYGGEQFVMCQKQYKSEGEFLLSY